MKRLRLILIIFALLLTLPLAWLVARTYDGLAREETAQLDFFAETILDQMEIDLAELIRREETRSVDEYSNNRDPSRSLALPPQEDFIIGYFQNGPDGSFQSPGLDTNKDLAGVNEQLRQINQILNLKRTTPPLQPEPLVKLAAKPATTRQKKKESSFAERYLSSDNLRRQRAPAIQEEKRVEKITIAQASKISSRAAVAKNMAFDLDISESDSSRATNAPAAAAPVPAEMTEGSSRVDLLGKSGESSLGARIEIAAEKEDGGPVDYRSPFRTLQVEVSPLQSLMIDNKRAFIFRSILLQGQSYRQGFVVNLPALLEHLATRYFRDEPMARFTALGLAVTNQAVTTASLSAGIKTSDPVYTLERTFPRPFSFLAATLSCDQVPASPGRQTLLIMSIGLAVIMMLGFLAVYRSAWVISDLSARKTGFVSSVTHELKTPLTNIRLYTEMLEQGMAQSREQEQEYFRIVSSESSRLVRLINNVLEFAKLERRQRSVNMQPGTFDEVISEVRDILGERLRQEDFTLKLEVSSDLKPFPYDREVMVQILTNLLENSIKFGNRSPVREITLKVEHKKGLVLIRVTDTGPGIPEQARKKVFDDFYRVENALTRQTNGTGIGLALVRKFAGAMGGKVSITNNHGAGCTVTVSLPAN